MTIRGLAEGYRNSMVSCAEVFTGSAISTPTTSRRKRTVDAGLLREGVGAPAGCPSVVRGSGIYG